jgi:hypothetical protein
METAPIKPELKKTTDEILMEAIAPKTREQLMRVLSGTGVTVGQGSSQGFGGGQQGGGQQSSGTFNKPSTLGRDLDMSEDDDVVDWNQ